MEQGLKYWLYEWAGASPAMLLWLQPDAPSISAVAWFVSALGSYWGAPIALTALAWWAHSVRDPRRAEAIDCQVRRSVVAGLLAAVMTWSLKHALAFPRPLEVMDVADQVIKTAASIGSLPSGHSVYAALLVTLLWPLVAPATRFALLAAVLAVGWSRIAQGLHYPADVVAGWIVGVGCALLARRVVVPLTWTPSAWLASASERLDAAIVRYRNGDTDQAFRLLKEAHVLGRGHLTLHAKIHGWMLRGGAARRDMRELLGQVARLALLPLGHLTGRLPLGNSRGADAPAFVPIGERLEHLAVGAGAPMAAEEPHRLQPSAYAWWTLAFAIAGLDLTVKGAVHDGLPYGISIPITEFFNIVHRRNTGAAFSMLADAGGWQRYFFIALALAVSVFLLGLLRRPLSRAEAVGYSLIVGGALGNALDRILRGYVVDYLDLHWGGYHWPAFNVADVAISLAVAALVVGSVKGHAVGASRPMEE